MAKIVNLRRAKKAKARAEKGADAEAARAAFGRTKSEKQASAAEERRAAKTLEAHKREKQ